MFVRLEKFAVAVIFGLGIGCGGEEPIPPPPPPPTSVGALEVGGGDGDVPGYIAVADGQDVTLEPGSQGGFHVFINVRLEAAMMAAATDMTLVLERQARREVTGQLVSTSKQRIGFVPSVQEGFFETEKSSLMFLCPSPVAIPVADEVLTVKVRALTRERDGDVIAEGTLRLIPRCPAGDQAVFCRRICSG